MPTFTADYSDDEPKADDCISPNSQSSTAISIDRALSSMMGRLTLTDRSANAESTATQAHELPEPCGFPFLRLPSEIKHIILREVFKGSQQTYSILKSYGHRLETTEYKLTQISDHRNILMASKRCWFEAIELYHGETTLVLDGDEEWSIEKIMQYLPSHCVNKVSVLSLSGSSGFLFASATFLLQPTRSCRKPLPKLRELYLPQRSSTLILKKGTDYVREKILDEFFCKNPLFVMGPPGNSIPPLFPTGPPGASDTSATSLLGSGATRVSLWLPSVPADRKVTVYQEFKVHVRFFDGRRQIEKVSVSVPAPNNSYPRTYSHARINGDLDCDYWH